MAVPTTAIILDFDTSKLHRVYSNRAAIASEMPTITVRQRLERLTPKLQSTIELAEILAAFHEEVIDAVPFDGVSYQHQGHQYEHTIGKLGGHSANYRLKVPDGYLGELCFYRSARRFSEAELEVLERFLTLLVYPLKNGLRYQDALRSALTDGLTGAGNRVGMESVMTREFDLAQRYDQPLSVLMLDLDYFKQVNDTFGHSAGDYVLQAVVHCIKSISRCVDTTFRYGGEEFVVLLNKTDQAGAKIMACRLCETVADLEFRFDGKAFGITASVGVATRQREESPDELLRRADQALYGSKRNGRNCVTLAEAPE